MLRWWEMNCKNILSSNRRLSIFYYFATEIAGIKICNWILFVIEIWEKKQFQILILLIEEVENNNNVWKYDEKNWTHFKYAYISNK